MFTRLIILAMLALPLPAWAVDAISGASRREQATNTPNAAIWIVGRGFVAGSTVTISGNGIMATPGRDPLVITEAERIDGGRGDGIAYYFSIAADADLGPRNITVTAPDGRSVTGMALIEIMPGMGPAPEPEPGPEGEPAMNPGPEAEPNPQPEAVPPPVPQDGVVTEVTRASPRAGEVGAQVNVWIAGRSFSPGLDVKFSDPALGPASFRGAPLAYGIVRNAESERGEYDGIQYYLRIGAEAQIGPVDVTVTAADGGSQAVGRGIFEVVNVGEAPAPLPGDGDIQAVSGASPAAVRAGRNVAIWMWGLGIAEGARIEFGAPGIEMVAPSEVVEQAANNPGFAGVRNYLKIDATAPPGPVAVTITNPNGTSATAEQLFTIVPPAGGVGGGNPMGGGDGPVASPGVVGDGTCPDQLTSIEGITEVKPAVFGRGEVINVAVIGRAFACGANVIIPGGGLTPLDEPRIVRDPADPLATTLFWRLQVADDARAGSRDLTVINPNNTSKTLVGAFAIDAPDSAAGSDDVAFCAQTPGRPHGAWWLLFLGVLGLRRRA